MKRIIILATFALALTGCGLARQQYATHLQTLVQTRNEAHQECLRKMMAKEIKSAYEADDCERKIVLAKADEIQFSDKKLYVDYYDKLMQVAKNFDNKQITFKDAGYQTQLINTNFYNQFVEKERQMQIDAAQDAAMAQAFGSAMQQQAAFSRQRALIAQQNMAVAPVATDTPMLQAPQTVHCQTSGPTTFTTGYTTNCY